MKKCNTTKVDLKLFTFTEENGETKIMYKNLDITNEWRKEICCCCSCYKPWLKKECPLYVELKNKY